MVRRMILQYTSLLFILVRFPYQASGEHGAVQIYVNLTANAHCFRLLNGTHQIGCQSTEGGNAGVVHVLSLPTDLDYVARDSAGVGAYIVALSAELFANASLAARIRQQSNVVGVIVFWSDAVEPTEPFSGDSQCPNQYSSYYDSQKSCARPWNAAGKDYWFHDWSKPIFLLTNATEIDIIRHACFEQFNQAKSGVAAAYPLCAASLQMFQDGARDTPTCIRRSHMFSSLLSLALEEGVCDPLADENVFAFVPPSDKRNASAPPVFMLLTRMDSFSMFTGESPGAQSSLTAVVAALAVAEAVGRRRAVIERMAAAANRSLVFALLHGESLDYIGSSRLLYDMSSHAFPEPIRQDVAEQQHLLHAADVQFVLELNQLGLSSDGLFYAHVDGAAYQKHRSAVDAVLASINGSLGERLMLADAAPSSQVPPASYQQFLLHGGAPAGAVLTDFGREFNSKFYDGAFDRQMQFASASEAVRHIGNLSEAVLQGALKWLSPNGAVVDVHVDSVVVRALAKCERTVRLAQVEQLFDCLIAADDWYECPLLQRVWLADSRPAEVVRQLVKGAPWSRTYIAPQSSQSAVRIVATSLLSWYLSTHKLNITAAECAQRNKMTTKTSYRWMLELSGRSNRRLCVASHTRTTVARSPAFELDDYDWASGAYSTWAESRWDSSSLRVFVIAPPAFQVRRRRVAVAHARWQVGLFVAGLLVTLVSFIVVCWVSRLSGILFDPRCGEDL